MHPNGLARMTFVPCGNHDKCLDVNLVTIAVAANSIFQDVIIVILPLSLLLMRNISWRKRRSIIVMFSLGIFVAITSCIRLDFAVVMAGPTNSTYDYTDGII